LLRQASVTHTNSMSQGFLSLSFTKTSTGLNVTMPANANLAPPGYYMLFILNGSGVPSVGSIIQISSTVAAVGTVTGKVTNDQGAPISGASVSSGGNGAITGADGGYTLQVPGGASTLTAALAGYQNASESVTVTAGESTEADPLKIQPINPGNISGTVTDGNGYALSGATVSAAGLSTTSGGDGNYALNNLPAGQTSILAGLTGYQSGSTVVSVVAASSTVAPPITLVSSSGSISGTVKNSAGSPIVGASVGYGGGTVTTDSYGNYTLIGIPVGTVQLVASAQGFQSMTQNVTVAGGKTSAADFALSAASANGTVAGKITNAQNGAIVAGATVSWNGGSTTSDASGIYALANVPAGTQNITAIKTGYLPHTLTATVTGGATSNLNIPIVTGGKITAKVVAPSGAVVSGATVTIKGGSIATTVVGYTSSTGLFTTNWVPSGTYSVSISKTGHATQTKTTTVASGATASLTFAGF
jgi:hypothetical protein